MSAIVTTNSRTVAVDAKAVRAVVAVVKAFQESDAVHVRRTRAIGALVAQGFSVRQIEDAVTVQTGGMVPTGFSRSSIGRYRLVHLAITRDDMSGAASTSDAVSAIVVNLYRLAGPNGGAATVSAAADDIAKAKGSQAAVDASQAHVDAFNAAQATTAAKALAGAAQDTARPVAGEAGNGGKAPAVKATPDADADADDTTSTADVKATLASHTTGALVAELTRRYSGKRATVHSDDADALAALVARVEELVTAGRVAGKR